MWTKKFLLVLNSEHSDMKQSFQMTENQIENAVSRVIDKLDNLLLTNRITQEDYELEIRVINNWAIQQYKNLNLK